MLTSLEQQYNVFCVECILCVHDKTPDWTGRDWTKTVSSCLCVIIPVPMYLESITECPFSLHQMLPMYNFSSGQKEMSYQQGVA